MGQSESTEPSLMNESTSSFAISFRPLDKLQIINAAKNIVQLVEGVLTADDSISYTRYKGSTNTYKMSLKGTPFSPGGGSSVDFKISFVRILNELYSKGHLVPYVASDLCLYQDTSTVFFRRSESREQQGNYACIAPSGIDCVDLIDIPGGLMQEMITIFDSHWGINADKTEQKRHNCMRIELSGGPWGYCSGDNATRVRRLLLKVIERMKIRQYRFAANMSLKGTCDLLFFQFDPSLVPDSSQIFVMYLSKTDRIRFLDAPEHLSSMVLRLVNESWKGGVTNECIHNEALEFKLKGRPWHSHSYDATPSRYLISIIFVEMMRAGTKVIGTLDISRRSDDKSIFIFETSPKYSLHPSVPIRWSVFYFCGRGKLMLIGIHNELIGLLNEQLRSVTEGPGVHEGNLILWRFSSYVFSYGDSSIRELFLKALLRIYEQMRETGWELISSADVSSIVVRRNKKLMSYDAHSWYFLNTTG